MRNARRGVVAVVAALITLFTGAAPVGAAARAAPPTAPKPWNMAPCATASLSETEVDDGHWLVIFGGAVQCAPTVSTGGVRLAVYPPDASTGTAAGYNVRLFGSAEPGATRSFGAAIGPPVAGESGVCVLAGDNIRISCARVTATETTPGWLRILTSPLDPADPLVAKPVKTSPYTGTVLPPVRPGDPNGVCGSCF